MLLWERRTKTSCAVTLVRAHMTGFLLDGAVLGSYWKNASLESLHQLSKRRVDCKSLCVWL